MASIVVAPTMEQCVSLPEDPVSKWTSIVVAPAKHVRFIVPPAPAKHARFVQVQ